MNNSLTPKLSVAVPLACLYMTPSIALAHEAWKVKSSVTVTTSHFADSLIMNNQRGIGLRLSGEKNEHWGFTAGLQSTRIGMTSIAPVSTQNQNNWLLSGFAFAQPSTLSGRWTFQIDTHKVSNDAKQTNTSDVHVTAPQIAWASYSLPLKVDFSYADSHYANTTTIRQTSASIAYGFHEAKEWLQVRSYAVNNLEPSNAFGKSSTHAFDIKLTHFLSSDFRWIPASLMLGLERGKKIYVVDMDSQTVHNMPMLNEGGENISATWKLSSKSNLNMQLSTTRYYAEPPHHFTLNTISAQISTIW